MSIPPPNRQLFSTPPRHSNYPNFVLTYYAFMVCNVYLSLNSLGSSNVLFISSMALIS